jgi:iron complex outermembrane recepter protein
VSMRGLGEDRTLVLVNGRRLAAQAGFGGTAVNINVIPLAAIERVEVLKDGASSLYGSDAMAGVVNFILKKDYTGLEISATTGEPTRSGGGDSSRIALLGGIGDLSKDRYNFTGSISFEREKALFGRDRSFAAVGTVLPFFVSGATGQGNIEGGYTPGNGQPWTSSQESARRQAGFGNSPGAGYGNPLAASNSCESIRMKRNPTPTSKGAPYCYYDSAPDVGLIPDRDLINLTGSFTFKLNDDHELFADALYGRSEVTQAIQPSPVRRSFLLTDALFAQQGIDPALLIRPANPNYQIAADYLNAQGFPELVGQTLAVTSRVFDFGPRTSEDESTQTRISLGVRGALVIGDNMDYEVVYLRNESELKGKVIDGYFSQTRFASVVNQPDSDYNPWSLQQSNTFNQRLAASNAKYVGPTLNAESTADQIEGLIRGNLFALPAGTAQFAAGAQFRQEDYVNSPSPALATGDIAGLGGSVPPVDKSRDASAIFAEATLPLMSDLEGGLGLRYDRYSDVGSSFNYKASLGWRPISGILARASTGTGFRAPSMEELYQPQTLGTSEQFDDPLTGQSDLQVNSLTGGNPMLDPEESRQTAVGLVWQATNAFSTSIDYWWIKIEDAIVQPSAQLVVSRFRAGDPAYAGLVTVSPSNDIDSIVQTLLNTGTLDVSGIDLGMEFKQAIGPGRMDVVLNGTYLVQFDETTPSGDISRKVGTIVDFNGDPVIGADSGGVALRWKHILSASYSQDAWSATVVQNFYRGYEMGHDLNGARRFVPSQSIYDLSLSYSGIKNTNIGIGVRNLFDTDPPVFVPVSNQFQTGYDAALEDPRRQFVYLTASYKFF